MSVVNCRVAFIRPRYPSLKEWMDDPNNIYIARSGVVFIEKERFPKTNSIWANPFKITKDEDRANVILRYETYIRERIATNPELLNELKKLKGKNLGCWCAPEPCHGHVLLRLIDEFGL